MGAGTAGSGVGVAKKSAKLHAGRDEAVAENNQPGVPELDPLASKKSNESMPKNSCEKANADGGSILSCAIRNKTQRHVRM